MTSESQNEENIIGAQSIPKLMLKYCVPAVIAMMITGVQGMVDGMIVGTFVGSNALASVNIAMPYISIIIGVSMIISVGAQSYIGINLGANNIEKAQDSFKTFLVITTIISILITIIGTTMSRQIASILGADQLLISDAANYIKIMSFFTLPTSIMFYFGFLSRIVGKPEKYLYGTILSIVVNISLDYLLVVVFDMGIEGAALATGIAYSSALVFVLSPMMDKNNAINVFAGRFKTESIKSVLYNGSSEGVNSLSGAVTTFLFNVSLMKIAGAGGVAAFTAISYVGMLGSLLLFGISDGIGPIVSYNYGMQDYKRVKKIMLASYIGNMIFGILLFVLLFFHGEMLVRFFIQDNPELIALAVQGGKLYSFSFLLSGFNILASGYFTFIGKGLESALVAASRGIVFTCGGILVLPLFLDINGIWLSVTFAEVCTAIGAVVLLKINAKSALKS